MRPVNRGQLVEAKRIFDFFFSLVVLVFLAFPIILCLIAAAIDTRSSGMFVQERIGRFGHSFNILKLRTIRENPDGSRNISRLGHFFRDTKIDELPQLLNVLAGDMSLVGPRPDIPGYYDRLEGEEAKILELRPGVTGPASLKYSNEEWILAQQGNRKKYNDEIIFPDKIKINLDYYYNRSFSYDLMIIRKTILNIFKGK